MQSTKRLSCVLDQPRGIAEKSLRKISRSLKILYYLLEFAYRICSSGCELGVSVGHHFKVTFGLDQRHKGTIGASLFFGRHFS